VTPYLSQNDPASLALVDRDTCQLAYSIQFANVQSDYGNVALGLATQLLQERIPVSGDRQYGTKPSVGSCIRCIIVAMNPGWLRHRHNLSLERLAELRETGENDEKRLLLETATYGYENYITSIIGKKGI